MIRQSALAQHLVFSRLLTEKDCELILQEETGLPKVVDPWAGSYFMEKLTHVGYSLYIENNSSLCQSYVDAFFALFDTSFLTLGSCLISMS